MSKNLSPLSVGLWAGACAGGVAAIAYAGACFALYSIQTKLIYRPLPQIVKTPAEVGLAYEDIWIPIRQTGPCSNKAEQTSETKQNEPSYLHAWWIPNPRSSRVMLFCHGNYGNISYNTERIRFHHAQGCSVLAFDYRGYGQSSGPIPSEQTVFADVEAAFSYLIAERKISPSNITVSGHSMGGAVAIDLASRHPDIDRLIVESSFTTMKDEVESKRIYSLFPIEALLTEPFDSFSKVRTLQMPVLYVHGDQDFDVPVRFSHQLYAATPGPKRIFIARGADHNMNTLSGDAYAAVLRDFYQVSDRTAQSTSQPAIQPAIQPVAQLQLAQ
ncbi:MAG: alpha/beta hydrolase [Phormidesmis sp.]